jgi:hypothetical protein
MDSKVKTLNDLIKQLENKDFNLYFFTLDTKGNPTAGIANIYEHVKLLTELGYNAHILHEKNDYKLVGDENGQGLVDWLGEEYANLPHVSIEAQGLNINAADMIIIPEIFANVMDQVKTFPCKKIVLSQSYDYLLELLPIAKRWDMDYGFKDVITTSVRQADYIKSMFPAMKTSVIPVSIPKYFKPPTKPKQPTVAIVTRVQGDVAKIAKSFYLQYPIYNWITFTDLRGLPREQFATDLAKSCLAVWVDQPSGFGTFPLEAMECETPVIGIIPNMVPEWMETAGENDTLEIAKNGIWTNTTLYLPELIATYLRLWLEDSIPSELYDAMKATTGRYTPEAQKTTLEKVYANLVNDRKQEFQVMLDSIKVETASAEKK